MTAMEFQTFCDMYGLLHLEHVHVYKPQAVEHILRPFSVLRVSDFLFICVFIFLNNFYRCVLCICVFVSIICVWCDGGQKRVLGTS